MKGLVSKFVWEVRVGGWAKGISWLDGWRADGGREDDVYEDGENIVGGFW